MSKAGNAVIESILANPNIGPEELLVKMEYAARLFHKDNSVRQQQMVMQQRAKVRAASGAELRKLANANLAKRYR